METVQLNVDRHRAGELYRKYREHLKWSKPLAQPIDYDIMRAYQEIAKGRMVIQALESIKRSGLDPATGLPKLAIVRASAATCYFRLERDGAARFSVSRWVDQRNTAHLQNVDVPAGFFPRNMTPNFWGLTAKAIVPLIPIEHRPRRGIDNYHILWEAEWSEQVPVDPMLLRRLAGDMWIVCAAWDLTDVERAALASRVHAA